MGEKNTIIAKRRQGAITSDKHKLQIHYRNAASDKLGNLLGLAIPGIYVAQKRIFFLINFALYLTGELLFLVTDLMKFNSEKDCRKNRSLKYKGD